MFYLDSSHSPVLIPCGLSLIQVGNKRPKPRDTPRITVLRELRETSSKVDKPTDTIMPTVTIKIPPMIGSGIVAKKAATFPKTARNIKTNAAATKTILLAT